MKILKKRVLGITGAIASGKSTLSAHLKERGLSVIDADKISKGILKEGKSAYDIVMREFPECVIEGTIDRRALGNIVFSDAKQLKKLNAITHPLIVEEITEQVQSCAGHCAIDAPLLFETGLQSLCDEVWCVYAPEDVRIDRICKRDGLTPDEAKLRIHSQMSDAVRLKLADRTFDSSRGLDEFLSEADSALDDFVKEK